MAHRAEINDCENCNEKDVCEVSNMMNNYGLRCKMFSPYRPLTNAERIRSMSDEELADWLNNDVEYWGKWCHDDAPVDQETLDCLRNGGECRLCILDWLKEEASE